MFGHVQLSTPRAQLRLRLQQRSRRRVRLPELYL
jgi:hypothetical protein